MKHMYIVDYGTGSSIKDKVDIWIGENEENILEIIDIEYTQEGDIYFAIVTYLERDKNAYRRD
ncbi:MAG: hypothetical protein GX300_10390 [Tissierellia bacterium]|nr:hypothetical protein [Tissierellia bacterium]